MHKIMKRFGRGVEFYPVMIRTRIDEWDGDIVSWAAREYNYLMEDDKNANYSEDDSVGYRGVETIVDNFIARKKFTNDIDEDNPGDVLLEQSQWTTLNGLDTLWDCRS